jgi:DNA-binding SARP family transcriptional activator
LNVALSSLRDVLRSPAPARTSDATPCEVLMADRHFVSLNHQCLSVDVSEFEDAVRHAFSEPSTEAPRSALGCAVELYGGRLLPGFYDEWVIAESERLDELFFSFCAV